MLMDQDQELLVPTELYLCISCSETFNKPLTIVGMDQTRDFIHVYDLVEGILKAARSKIKNQIYNIGGGQEISVNKIANLIVKKKPIFPKDLENQIGHLQIFQD